MESVTVPRLSSLLLLVALHAAIASANGGPAADDLEMLIAQALLNNPEILVSEQRLQMSTEKARQADSLEDPMMMLKIQNGLLRDPFDFERESDTAKILGLSQSVPFFGKRDLRRTAAMHDVAADKWRIEERKLALRRMVKQSWYRLSFIDRSLQVLEKTIAALGDLLRFSETMYGVGKGEQQDILNAQLERSKMEEMRITLEQRRRSLTATLNTLVYRPVESALPPIPPAVIIPLQLDQTELEQLADSHRPALKALTALIEKAQVNRRLAEKESYPDFTFSFEYMQREATSTSEGDDMYSASLSFNLPIRNERLQAMAAEAGAETRMLVHEQSVLRNQIRLEVADSLAALERNRRLVTLYEQGILDQAAAVLETTIASYQAGTTDFNKVLDGQMALFNLERDYHEAVADYQTQMAMLESLVGIRLSAQQQERRP